MGMHPFRIISIILIIITFLIGIALYPSLPDEIPTHWNVEGEVDGTMPVLLGLFLLPAMMAGISALLIIMPRFDPKYARYEEFQGSYDGVALLLNLFLFILFIITILWSVGIEVPMNQVMSLMFALLMAGIAFFIRNVKQNWFGGIRTPWTMESEEVWDETHKRGFRVFLVIAVFCLFGVIIPEYAYLFILLPVIIGSMYLVIYSYLLWKKEKQA